MSKAVERGAGFEAVHRLNESRTLGVYATYQEAADAIAEFEARTGQVPGCDHGFGVGSGYVVRRIDDEA